MSIQRHSKATWNGTLKEGHGSYILGEQAYEGKYSFPSRFESGDGTNPEELIAAAHAACYAMALSAGLGKDGFTPKQVKADARVTLEKVGEGFEITQIHLSVEADVPGLDAAKFQEYVEATKKGCPISKALASVKSITVEAKLLTAV